MENEKTENRIISHLKEIRKKRKLKVYEMSALLDIKAAYGEYNKLESGKRIPKVDKALRIARALGKKVEDIWEIKEEE